MFKAIYDSPWHSPAFFWFAGALFLIALARHLPWLAGALVLFQTALFADALATGAWPPGGLQSSSFMTPVAIAFVILGDLRFFVIVERFTRRTMGARGWLLAIGLSLIVPLASTATRLAWPAAFSEPRVTFLTYELMFLALATSLRVLVFPRRLADATPGVRRWLLGLATYEIAQYGLWALADILILAGVSPAHLLRLVPNALYYAFFLPFVWWTAPAEARA
jgi:hypothetical protein